MFFRTAWLVLRKDVADAPPVLFEVLAAQRRRLQDLQKNQGDYVSPLALKK